MAEISIIFPVNRIVGCDAKCEDDITYNKPLPQEGVVCVPFEISFD
jgi:hypothetical protein